MSESVSGHTDGQIKLRSHPLSSPGALLAKYFENEDRKYLLGPTFAN